MGSKYDVDRMTELYAQGLGYILISKEIGCSKGTVQHHLEKRGIARRPPPEKCKIPQEEAQLLYEESGWTLQRLADKYGLSCKRMHKISKRLGWKMRRRGVQSGEKHFCWKGGRTTDKDGYVLVYTPDHPHANQQRRVREHRLVMEQHLGRYLEPGEVVHHLNDLRDDNRLENLELFSSNGEHLAETLAGKCPNWTPEGRRRTLDGVQKAAASRKKKARRERESPQTTPRSTGVPDKDQQSPS